MAKIDEMKASALRAEMGRKVLVSSSIKVGPRCNSAWHQCHYTYDFNEDKPTVRKLGFSDDETKDILEKALKR